MVKRMPIKDRIQKNAYFRDYYGKHKKTINARRKTLYSVHGKQYHKDKYEKLRNEIFALLGNYCSNCGFSDRRALEIDHVNGGGLKQRQKFKSTLQYYRFVLSELKNGSKDYQSLCANCNQIKRIERNENRKSV